MKNIQSILSMGNIQSSKVKCPECVPAHYFQNQSALIEHLFKDKHSQRLIQTKKDFNKNIL